MSKCPRLAPTGILDFKYSPCVPFYFHILWCTQTGTDSFQAKMLSCVQPPCPSLITLLLLSLLFPRPSHPFPVPFFPPHRPLHLSVSLSQFVQVSIYWRYLSAPLLYSCAPAQTKAGHVGMHVQQIWRWLCDSRDEVLEQLHSSLIRWHTDTNRNHNSRFLSSSRQRRAQKERPVLCNLG